jgi:hypothetical protein
MRPTGDSPVGFFSCREEAKAIRSAERPDSHEAAILPAEGFVQLFEIGLNLRDDPANGSLATAQLSADFFLRMACQCQLENRPMGFSKRIEKSVEKVVKCSRFRG